MILILNVNLISGIRTVHTVRGHIKYLLGMIASRRDTG